MTIWHIIEIIFLKVFRCLVVMSEEYNSKCLFPTGDGDRPTIEEFEKMVEEAENSPTITYEEFKKEVDEWLKKMNL